MKKSLFIILAALFCISLAAQTQSAKDWKLQNAVAQKAYKTTYGGANEVIPTDFIPEQRPAQFTPKGGDYLYGIGNSYYLMQTNNNARNTINWSPDGKFCTATWTYGTKVGSQNVRGTAVNYFDQVTQTWKHNYDEDTQTVTPPLERVEQGTSAEVGNPGWGTHVFTEKGECVIAHSAAAGGTGALVINYRENWAEGEWQQYILKGPVLSNGNTDMYWPTVTAVGNTIHLVCVTSSDDDVTYEGIWCRPIYFKSTDGGKTWSEPKIFGIDVMPEIDQINVRGDDYVLTARGSHVVLAYCGGVAAYLESFNDGDTWTYHSVYKTEWDWFSTGKWIGPTMAATTIAAAIGEDDVVHITFSAHIQVRKPDTEPNFYSYYPFLCGLYTWKEGQPTMTHEDMGIQYDFDNDEWIDWGYDLLPNFMDAPELLGFPEFTFWDASKDMILNNYSANGYICHPRLIAEGGKVYLMYSSIIEEPMLYNSEAFYRGVFLTVSKDNGDTYDQKNNTSWLSYHPRLFWYEWENYERIDTINYEHNDGMMEFYVSENGYPSMATSIKNNSLVFTWENDIFPMPGGSSWDPWNTVPFAIYSLMIPAKDAGAYYNTQDIWNNKGSKVEEKETLGNLKVYPNPACEGYAMIEVGTQNPFTLTVTNMMGQVMFTGKGQGANVKLNVSDFPAGIYVVNVKTDHASASQKLIVK